MFGDDLINLYELRDLLMKVEIFPVRLPLIKKGDDIAELIVQNFEIEDGDIISICSTIVSKAEGRVADLKSYKPDMKAIEIAKRLNKDPEFIQAVLDETDEILLEYPFLLVRAKTGNVCVNAGVDVSNVERGKVVLPLRNPDEAAERIRKRIEDLCGKRVGVIITDTGGRCFRRGVVGFAVGVSGVRAIRNWIGKEDLYGNKLEITIECVVDEIAGFANLLMGEGNWGIPVVVFRGLADLIDRGSMRDVYRSEEEDIIRRCLRICRDTMDYSSGKSL